MDTSSNLVPNMNKKRQNESTPEGPKAKYMKLQPKTDFSEYLRFAQEFQVNQNHDHKNQHKTNNNVVTSTVQGANNSPIWNFKIQNSLQFSTAKRNNMEDFQFTSNHNQDVNININKNFNFDSTNLQNLKTDWQDPVTNRKGKNSNNTSETVHSRQDNLNRPPLHMMRSNESESNHMKRSTFGSSNFASEASGSFINKDTENINSKRLQREQQIDSEMLNNFSSTQNKENRWNPVVNYLTALVNPNNMPKDSQTYTNKLSNEMTSLQHNPTENYLESRMNTENVSNNTNEKSESPIHDIGVKESQNCNFQNSVRTEKQQPDPLSNYETVFQQNTRNNETAERVMESLDFTTSVNGNVSKHNANCETPTEMQMSKTTTGLQQSGKNDNVARSQIASNDLFQNHSTNLWLGSKDNKNCESSYRQVNTNIRNIMNQQYKNSKLAANNSNLNLRISSHKRDNPETISYQVNRNSNNVTNQHHKTAELVANDSNIRELTQFGTTENIMNQRYKSPEAANNENVASHKPSQPENIDNQHYIRLEEIYSDTNVSSLNKLNHIGNDLPQSEIERKIAKSEALFHEVKKAVEIATSQVTEVSDCSNSKVSVTGNSSQLHTSQNHASKLMNDAASRTLSSIPKIAPQFELQQRNAADMWNLTNFNSKSTTSIFDPPIHQNCTNNYLLLHSIPNLWFSSHQNPESAVQQVKENCNNTRSQTCEYKDPSVIEDNNSLQNRTEDERKNNSCSNMHSYNTRSKCIANQMKNADKKTSNGKDPKSLKSTRNSKCKSENSENQTVAQQNNGRCKLACNRIDARTEMNNPKNNFENLDDLEQNLDEHQPTNKQSTARRSTLASGIAKNSKSTSSKASIAQKPKKLSSMFRSIAKTANYNRSSGSQSCEQVCTMKNAKSIEKRPSLESTESQNHEEKTPKIRPKRRSLFSSVNPLEPTEDHASNRNRAEECDYEAGTNNFVNGSRCSVCSSSRKCAPCQQVQTKCIFCAKSCRCDSCKRTSMGTLSIPSSIPNPEKLSLCNCIDPQDSRLPSCSNESASLIWCKNCPQLICLDCEKPIRCPHMKEDDS